MGDPTAVLDARCPSCAATVRAGSPWCTLCYADLRPKPAPEPPPVLQAPPAASYGTPALDPLLAPAPTAAGPTAGTSGAGTTAGASAGTSGAVPTWPCTTCGAANAITLPACASCGAGFLSRLRETEGPLLELPVVGDLGAMSRGQRLGLAAGVVLAVIALVAVLGLLFS